MKSEILNRIADRLIWSGHDLKKLSESNSDRDNPNTPEPSKPEPERPNVQKPGLRLLDCPFAENPGLTMPTQGTTRYKGAVVHHTAGRSARGDKDAIATASYGASQNFAFWTISSDGSIFQTHKLNRWGYHSGSHHHRTHLGIEICRAGLLSRGSKISDNSWNWNTWFGEPVPKDEVRWVEAEANRQRGAYQAFTDEQEEALIKLLCWLKHNDPEYFSFDDVIGHDEIWPGEKNDPGGSLSMTMPALRELLPKRYDAIYGVSA